MNKFRLCRMIRLVLVSMSGVIRFCKLFDKIRNLVVVNRLLEIVVVKSVRVCLVGCSIE